MKGIYLDNSATTPVDKRVLEAMLPYFSFFFGNPSSSHGYGKIVKEAIETSRVKVAKELGASSNEIYFTSGGSESDNWAIKGTLFNNLDKGRHIITTNIEHHAILNSCKYIEKQGYDVTYVKVESNGIVNIKEIEKSIRPDTVLISVMMVNNEVGTIQPIKEIGELAKRRKIYFHTDAVQAIGNLLINVNDMNIDMLSLSGHKFYGPKGIGVLYLRNGINIGSYVHGGSQERKKRAGTENVASIVGIGKAIELAYKDIYINNTRVLHLRNKLIKSVINNIRNVSLNGDLEKRVAGNVNFCFKGVNGQELLRNLNNRGIAVSTGSACNEISVDPSDVLLALGLSPQDANSSIRFSIGSKNTEAEIDYVIKSLYQFLK